MKNKKNNDGYNYNIDENMSDTDKKPTFVRKVIGTVAWCVFVPVLWVYSKLTGKGLE